MPLETELSTFERLKDHLLVSYAGKFALIHGADFIGAYDTTDNAYAEGVDRFGQDEFLVKLIAPATEVHFNPALYLGMIGHARF